MARKTPTQAEKYPNEAAGIAGGNFIGESPDYSQPMAKEDRVIPVLSAYDGIFRSSYRFPPYNTDQLIGMKGYDFMEDMLKMSCCWAIFNLKRYAVLKDGINVIPSIADPLSSDHEESKFFADSLRYCIDNITDVEVDMPQTFRSVIFDMQMAAWLGFRASEIEYRNLDQNSPGLQGRYGFTGFWSKTNKQMGFDIDEQTLNPKRFISYTPNGGFQGDIHPEKIWYYCHNKSHNVPTGEGDARRVYKNWFALDVLQKLWAIALERWGAPVFVAQYPAGDDGELQAALNIMNQIRQGQSPIIPDNIKFELVTCPAGVFEAFEATADWHVRQISTTIHSSTLTTGEGSHGATSAGSNVHQDSSELVYDDLSQNIEDSFNMQVARRWMRYNWGEASLRLMPSLKLRSVKQSAQDIATLASALSMLVNMGNMPAQSSIIRDTLGIAPIDADEMKLIEQEKEAEMEAQERLADASNSGKAKYSSDHEAETAIRLMKKGILAREELKRRNSKVPVIFATSERENQGENNDDGQDKSTADGI